MQPVAYFYLILLAIFCFSLILFVYTKVYRKGRQDDNRYKLYKIRDDLIYLIAKGSISENDFIYQTFYEMTNTYINQIHKFNLRQINKAMQEAKEKGYLKEIQEFTQKIISELNTKDSEVKHVVIQFFVTMLEILRRNSLALRILIRYMVIYRLARAMFKKLSPLERVFVDQEAAYQNYKIHNDIYASLEKAAF